MSIAASPPDRDEAAGDDYWHAAREAHARAGFAHVAGAGPTAILAVGGPAGVVALAIGEDGDRILRIGTALFAFDAASCPLDALAATIPMRPARSADLVDLGLMSDCADWRARRLAADILATCPVLSSGAGMGTLAPKEPPEQTSHPFLARLDRWPQPNNGTPLARACLSLDAVPAPPQGHRDAPQDGDRLDLRISPMDAIAPDPAVLDRIAAWIDPWARAVDALVHPGAPGTPPVDADGPGIPFVDPPSWSPEVRAYYLAPGETGRRRRQAGALYPFLSGAIARDPETVALVDAGRPYERRLAAICDAAADLGATRVTRSPVSPRSPAVLDVARLRRLRGMPFSRDVFGPRVYEAAELARFLYGIAETPLHLVPSRPDDWGRFFRQGLPVLESRFFRRMHPDLSFRGFPRDWDLAAWALRIDPDHDTDAPICQADGIADMLDRAARDLGPAILDPGCPPDRHDRLARHLLLAGRGYLEAWRLSHRWHMNLAPFDALLEYGIEATWPAWFAPFDGPDGTRIACLVDGRSLADEGGRGPDASGVPGLDHCVGGYVRDCRTGRRCVASITGPGPDGGRIRLSTVEFSPFGARLEVEQHLGYRNGEPPDEAKRCLAAFLDLAGRGVLPVEPHTAPNAERVAPPPELAFATWRPYLAGWAAEAGFEGVRAQCARGKLPPVGPR